MCTHHNNNYDDDKTVIGGFNNSRTIIRKQKRIVISQSTNNVLSSDEPIEFKIDISSRAWWCWCFSFALSSNMFCVNFYYYLFCLYRPDGEINIYREGQKIVQAFDQQPLNINFVSFGNFDANVMDFFYNCRNNSDFDNIDQLKGDMVAYGGVYNGRSASMRPTIIWVLLNVIFIRFMCGVEI